MSASLRLAIGRSGVEPQGERPRCSSESVALRGRVGSRSLNEAEIARKRGGRGARESQLRRLAIPLRLEHISTPVMLQLQEGDIDPSKHTGESRPTTTAATTVASTAPKTTRRRRVGGSKVSDNHYWNLPSRSPSKNEIAPCRSHSSLYFLPLFLSRSFAQPRNPSFIRAPRPFFPHDLPRFTALLAINPSTI